MFELSENEYAFVFGGKTVMPTILQQVQGAISQGNYGTAIGLMMDNPYTMMGNGIDQIRSAINRINNSAAQNDLNDALSKSQMPAH